MPKKPKSKAQKAGAAFGNYLMNVVGGGKKPKGGGGPKFVKPRKRMVGKGT